MLTTVLGFLALAFLWPAGRRLFSRLPGRPGDCLRLLLTFGAVFFVAAMMANPRLVFEGSLMGLKTWWNIVFPALLPFFIASEFFMSFGVVHFMGVLLEPLMRGLFNVPGTGAFVVATGFTSGYPIGSMLTARLRSQGLCTRVEAERLMSFTNNSSPLFMLVAVAVGMFDNPALGWIIAGGHYLSNLTLGLALRFYGRGGDSRSPSPFPRLSSRRGSLFTQALREMIHVQRQDKRPFGRIMADSITNSVQSLLKIGGFIILFAVIIRLLTESGFIHALAGFFGLFLAPLGFAPEVLTAMASGFFEMTIGCKLAAEAPAPLMQQVVAVGMILAWSGLCIQAQAAAMVAETDIRLTPFMVCRVAQAILAGFFTFLLFVWTVPV
ncbi:MAG: sporulation integral membrane protein YlbJ, partial [Peptococcaceae bacterium]|nr:sporulation integral membrane protein YlbJ [Peptococcaceae bacterium]